jgi:hypothetical protein
VLGIFINIVKENNTFQLFFGVRLKNNNAIGHLTISEFFFLNYTIGGHRNARKQHGG